LEQHGGPVVSESRRPAFGRVQRFPPATQQPRLACHGTEQLWDQADEALLWGDDSRECKLRIKDDEIKNEARGSSFEAKDFELARSRKTFLRTLQSW